MLNVITLFSGYDSQCLALDRLGIDYDLVACLYYIFDRLFIHTEPMYGEQLKLI